MASYPNSQRQPVGCRGAPCRSYQEVGGCGIIPPLHLWLYTTGSLQTRWQTQVQPLGCIARLDESSRMAGRPYPQDCIVQYCNIIWGIQDEGSRSSVADIGLGNPRDYPTVWRPSLPRPGASPQVASAGWMSRPRWWVLPTGLHRPPLQLSPGDRR